MALSQADVDAVVKGVFDHVINAVSLGYSQPFAEYVKYDKANSMDLATVNKKLDQILAILKAGGVTGVTVEQVQKIVADSRIVPGQ